MSDIRSPMAQGSGPSGSQGSGPSGSQYTAGPVGWPRKQSEAERKLEELRRILNEDKGDLAGLGALWRLVAWLVNDRIEQLRRIDEAAK